jgi:hypothetical protein
VLLGDLLGELLAAAAQLFVLAAKRFTALLELVCLALGALGARGAAGLASAQAARQTLAPGQLTPPSAL